MVSQDDEDTSSHTTGRMSSSKARCRTVRTGETSFIVPIVGDEDVSNERSRTRRTAQAQGAAKAAIRSSRLNGRQCTETDLAA
jgi:hypothetical protein